jgi:peptide/nickel transport system substrate-binding protein
MQSIQEQDNTGRAVRLLRRLALVAVAALALPAWGQPAPQRGGTLTWIIPQEPAAFVPLTTSAGGSTELGPKVIEGLLAYDRELKPVAQLATAWNVSADGLRYTFTLRKGVKWHDGQPFTSADAAYSIATLKTVHPRGRVTFANVGGIDTPDDSTLVLRLEKPAPYLLTALSASESPIVPRHLYEGKDVATNPRNNSPVGTGPFIFKEWVRGSHVRLERNPDYWDAPKPYLDAAVARFIPEAAARAAALESGEAQLANKAISLSDIDRFEKLKNVAVDVTPWPYVGDHQQIYFNFDSEPFRKREVRQAVAQSLNIDVFARTVWYGRGVVSASPIGKTLTRFHDDAIRHYPYDVKAAEAALDAAGYPRKADGKRFKVRLLYNPFQDRRAAEFVRQALLRVGLDAELESLDFATYVTRVYTDRAFDITLENLTNMFDPTIGVQRVFWSRNFKIGLPFSNASHYQNPEVDRLLEAAAVEPDEARRRQLFGEFQRVVREDVASIELGANPNVTIVARKVQAWNTTAEGTRGNFADVYLAGS